MKSFIESNFVLKFLSDNGSEELVEKWNAQENIETFNKSEDALSQVKMVEEKKVYKKESSPKKKTGYAYFCSVNRERIKIDNPQMKGLDVVRELARLWKELSKEDRKEWSASSAELYIYWKNIYDKRNPT